MSTEGGIAQCLTKKDLVRAILWFGSEKDGEGNRFFCSTVKLQKLFFLIQNDERIDFDSLKSIYDDVWVKFQPHMFGPFSDDINRILTEFRKEGEVEVVKNPEDANNGGTKYYFTDKLKQNLQQKMDVLQSDEFRQFLASLGPFYHMSPAEILKYVYSQEEYSSYLRDSMIAKKLTDE